MLKIYYLMLIFVAIECRPYTDNESSKNIQVISRNTKKQKDAHNKLDSKLSNEISNPRTLDGITDLYTGGIVGGLDLLENALFAGKNSVTTTTSTTTSMKMPITTTITPTAMPTTSGHINTEIPSETTTPLPTTTTLNRNISNFEMLQYVNNLTDIIMNEFNNSLTKYRETRQKDPKTNEVESVNNVEATTFRFDSSERQEEEEEGNAVAGLISQFLSGLSKPDGGVDVDAIVGLISGLSVQREDGTFDFEGLTDLLMGFFGAEGGSDVGAFLGGLLGAAIKGLAKPPGAKGAGIFAGTVLNGILPALSAPAPPPEGEEGMPTQKPMSDSGGFITGLLKTILSGSSGGNMMRGNGNGNGGALTQVKNNFLKGIFQVISSVFSVSSSSGNKG